MQAGREAGRVDARERGERLVGAGEAQQIVGRREAVVGVGGGRVGDDVEEAAVLRGERVVEDLAPRAELVGAGVDQRRVLEVLVPAARERVEVDDRAGERGAGRAHERLLVA